MNAERWKTPIFGDSGKLLPKEGAGKLKAIAFLFNLEAGSLKVSPIVRSSGNEAGRWI